MKVYIWDTSALVLFFAKNETAIKIMNQIEKKKHMDIFPR